MAPSDSSEDSTDGKKQRVASNESFWWAVRHGDSQKCRTLIKQGVNINARVGGFSALHHAAIQGHQDIVFMLLQHGADIDATTSDNRSSALHHAALRGFSNSVWELVRHGCNIDAQTSDTRRTALMNALVRNHCKTVAVLLQYGASLIPRDKSGDTALAYAHTDELRKLILGKVSPSVYLSGEGNPIVAQWSEGEKQKLTESNCLRILYIGDYMAGKTSLVQSIISESSFLADVDDRTVIAELSHWMPDPKLKKTFSLVDLGGHQSYLSSGHYFHTNAPNNVATLCHDITSNKYYKSFVWVRSVLTRSPKCHIIAVLTKCDKLDQKKTEAKLKKFISEMKENMEKEVDSLEVSIIMAQENKSAKLQTFVDLRAKYQTLCSNLEQITFLISCKKGYENSTLRLKEYYYILSEMPENKVFLPKYTHILFSKIGNLGVRHVTGSHSHQIHQTLSDYSTNANVSSSTSSTEELKKKNGNTEPVKSSDLENTCNMDKKEAPELHDRQYITLEEVSGMFEDILVSNHIPTSNVADKVRTSLLCLHQHGLLMYFTGSPDLEGIVFHNLSSFVSLLRCLFHHDLNLAAFSLVPAKLRVSCYRNNERSFDDDVKLLQTQGLLSKTMMSVLLSKGNCDIDAGVVIQLLDTLEIGFSFIPEGLDAVHTFIPYFIEQEADLSQHITQEMVDIAHSSEDFLSLHSQIRGNFPSTYWSYMVVHFCKVLHNNMQSKVIWKYGLLATLGKSQAKLMLTYNGKDAVDFVIRAKLKDTKSHDLLWRYMRLLSRENDSLMMTWWPGLVTSKVLLCTHCVLADLDRKPYSWCLDSLLSSQCEADETCSCQNEPTVEFPSALVMPLPSDQSDASDRLSDLKRYMARVVSSTYTQGDDNSNTQQYNENTQFHKGSLETQNQQKCLDDMLMIHGTYILRKLLQKCVKDKWGHPMELLLTFPAVNGFKSDQLQPRLENCEISQQECESFKQLIFEDKKLVLFKEERLKIREGDLNMFDISLLVKLLRVDGISGLAIGKKKWQEISQDVEEKRFISKTESFVDAVLLISHYRNEIHNKTDQSQLSKQILDAKLQNLKSAICDIGRFVGLSEEEVFTSCVGERTLLVYEKPLHVLQQAMHSLTGSSS